MEKNISVLKLALFIIFLASCSSDKVVTSNIFQKRKYNKGFYFDGFTNKEMKISESKKSLENNVNPINSATKPCNRTETASNIDKLEVFEYELNPRVEKKSIFTHTPNNIQPYKREYENLKNLILKDDSPKTNSELSVIYGLLGLAFPVIGLFAIYHGFKGLKKDEQKGKAISGIILGLLGTFISIITIIFIVAIINSLSWLF